MNDTAQDLDYEITDECMDCSQTMTSGHDRCIWCNGTGDPLCNDCAEPIDYDYDTDTYTHRNPAAAPCFLIR